MTITRIQGPARGLANTGTVINITLTSAPTHGNTLVCTAGGFIGGSISTITQSGVTWAKAITQLSGGCNLAEVWYGIVTSSSANTSISISFAAGINYPAYTIADICEYSGLQGTVDQTAVNPGGVGSITNTGTTPPTTVDDELFVGATYAITNGGGSSEVQNNPQYEFTVFDGTTAIGSNYTTSLAYLEKIVSGMQVAVSGTTIAQAANWVGCIATFKGGARYNITASVSTHCSISPSGSITVYEGDDQAFNISADTGFQIAHVYVDSVDQGTLSSYTFYGITANHTIFVAAETTPSTYDIIAVADPNASISPSGAVAVTAGGNQEFTVEANPDYHITHLYVDFVDQGAISTYTFENVTTTQTIFVTSESDDAYAPAFELNGNLTVNGGTELSGNAIIDGNVQAASYKASDGTTGATSNVSLAGVTTLQFKNGLLVGTS